jgi:hypothetical protein
MSITPAFTILIQPNPFQGGTVTTSPSRRFRPPGPGPGTGSRVLADAGPGPPCPRPRLGSSEMSTKGKKGRKSSGLASTTSETQQIHVDSASESLAREMEEFQKQLSRVNNGGDPFDIFRTEWTVEEDMFILKHYEVRKFSPKKCERLYESARALQPKSYTKSLSHEDLTCRYEELKSPELSTRRELLLKIVQSRCISEEEEAEAEAEKRRLATEEEKAIDFPAQRRPSGGDVVSAPEEDMVQILVIDALRCPMRVVAGRRALRSSPVLRGMLQSAPPPRPPDYRPEIVLDAAADGFADLAPYNVIQVDDSIGCLNIIREQISYQPLYIFHTIRGRGQVGVVEALVQLMESPTAAQKDFEDEQVLRRYDGQSSS